jgi:hypothetical protein
VNTLASIWSNFWSAVAARVFPDVDQKQSDVFVRACFQTQKRGPMQGNGGELLRCGRAFLDQKSERKPAGTGLLLRTVNFLFGNAFKCMSITLACQADRSQLSGEHGDGTGLYRWLTCRFIFWLGKRRDTLDLMA